LAVELDGEHWLTWGAGEQIAALHGGDEPLIAIGDAEVAGRFAPLAQLHVSGLLWPEAAGRITETAYLARESVGRGQLILFANDPLFRAISLATQRLFVNAVVLGPGLGSDFPSPW